MRSGEGAGRSREARRSGRCSCSTALRRVYVAQEPQFAPGVTRVRRGGRGRGRGAGAARALRGTTDGTTTSTRCRRASRRSTAGPGSSASTRVAATAAPRRRGVGRRAVRRHARSASRWHRRWSPRPTCCCSTSRRTTSTSMRSSGCRSCSTAGAARSSWSRTTARSSTRVATRIVELDRGVLRSYPGNFARLRGDRRRASSRPRRWPARAPTSCWRRKRSGCARASRRAARAASAASRGSCSCASSAQQRREQLGQVRLEIDAGAAAGQDRRRVEATCDALRRQAADRPVQRHPPARRQGRPDRPQRRGQDHAAQADPRRIRADLGHACAAAPGCRSRISTRCARPRPRRDAGRHHQPGQRVGRGRRRSAST